jgi:hypothetical protein
MADGVAAADGTEAGTGADLPQPKQSKEMRRNIQVTIFRDIISALLTARGHFGSQTESQF